MEKNDFDKLDKKYAQLELEENYRRQVKLMQQMQVRSIDDLTDLYEAKEEDITEEIAEKIVALEDIKRPEDETVNTNQEIVNTVDVIIEEPVENLTKADSENEKISLGNINEKVPYFVSHKTLGPKLIDYWDLLECCVNTSDFRPANVIITSIPGNGKTSFATSLATAVIGAARNSVSDLYCHIEAGDFNKKDIGDLYRKYSKGVILIENAANMSDESILSLKLLMEIGEIHPLVMLEMIPEEREGFLSRMDFLKDRFTKEIHIPVFEDAELAEFAVYYAGTQNFLIDNMALLKIHSMIINRQSFTHHVNLAEMAGFVDDAIEVSGKRLLKKLFFSKTQRELETPVLTENDFKQKI